MSYLREIDLFQFKNYPEKHFSFSKRIIGFTGNNGVGKTNLLDAIHYLGLTRSYFGRNDVQATQFGSQGFRIQGVFKKGEQEELVSCILRENGKKEISVNGTIIPRQIDHIGAFPIVFIAPDDAQLIIGDSKDRRAFIDQLICQLDSTYLQQLLTYNRVLQQRNAQLKEAAVEHHKEDPLLDIYDQQLQPLGQHIFEKRKSVLADLIPATLEIYHQLACTSEHKSVEKPLLFYKSELHTNSFESLLKTSRTRDIYLQRTTKGIHRDDLECLLEEQPFKQISSQGQRKSLLFALKLASLQLLDKTMKHPPLLLLDDFFEKLDDSRIENLLQFVCNQVRSQVFLTHTSTEKLQHHLKKTKEPYEIIEIKAT